MTESTPENLAKTVNSVSAYLEFIQEVARADLEADAIGTRPVLPAPALKALSDVLKTSMLVEAKTVHDEAPTQPLDSCMIASSSSRKQVEWAPVKSNEALPPGALPWRVLQKSPNSKCAEPSEQDLEASRRSVVHAAEGSFDSFTKPQQDSARSKESCSEPASAEESMDDLEKRSIQASLQQTPRSKADSARSKDDVVLPSVLDVSISEDECVESDCNIRFAWLRQLVTDSLSLCEWFPESEDMKLAKGNVLGQQLPLLFDALEATVLDAIVGDTLIALTQIDLARQLAKEGIGTHSAPATAYVGECARYEAELRKKYHM
eukprot:gnl/MRDRNA2_/MRDRNA2_98057_c0_seq1.p1 gnl/MRDRNA2_/MRDRNA2_98057_c0~~gnl/MRDRNA2_/MRDRNA2_98057_c0_seq1.p1  ORF type:complete len:320 (-),score=67.51 gnl/MRDRNA2_/MRDRNA2_98057_c0_seq1:156-1115(-)